MRTPLSQRMAQVQTPMVPVVGEWIRQYPGTISLGQGVVHYDAPDAARTAAAQAITNQRRIDRYASVLGADELLAQIADKVIRENDIRLDDRYAIVVTSGSNMGFLNAILAIADPGEEIILVSPFYFNHEMAIDMAGCLPVIIPAKADYQLDMAAVENAITHKTRAIVTVSPNNPTGAVYAAEDLLQINQLCQQKQIYHISDEAYEYFVYDHVSHFSAASLPNSAPHTISLFTLSKAYGMAGWRMGYMVIPSDLLTNVKKIQDTNLVCPPIVNQLAAAAALQAGRSWCQQQIAGFQEVRNLVLHELATLGDRCTVPTPQGAFYALARLETAQLDLDIVQRLIREFGIAVMPGSTFGVDTGCSIRIAYGALDKQTVASGMARLVTGL
ncbi:MAG: pyridoxal phosphate-dependent aminotransferase, partial [Planctomycetales bacterium]|nr:pyridoxal phosphate-dependent aminotransferase [Planctomycetales bacterium]